MKVLLVEDHEDLREMLKEALEAEGFEVWDAGLGLDGVRAAWDYRPDVVVLDVMLPDISGWEVMRGIRSREGFSRVPILFFSGSIAEQSRFASEKQKKTRFLLKPVAIDVLAESIRNLVRGTRQSRFCMV